ncbi:MAG: hypothetical protein HY321_15025 [Armatimonadetes bacterium]|nr:hypothetical protein [Armatimonadota bacterium]
MPRDDAFTQFERDLGRRKPNPRHGTPWIGTELDRSGEIPGAYPGTGSSLPQDIGADGFEVEPPPDEERDDLSSIATNEEDISPADEFDVEDLDMTPGMDGQESLLDTIRSDRASRTDRIEEDETPLDAKNAGGMSESAELTELPFGSENTTAGELGRYECPNCGFEYDVVVGTSARCPSCQYEADLSSIIGDEAFHHSAAATELDG